VKMITFALDSMHWYQTCCCPSFSEQSIIHLKFSSKISNFA
jgi:hypothetical protein